MMRGTLSGASALGGSISASGGLGGTITTGGMVHDGAISYDKLASDLKSALSESNMLAMSRLTEGSLWTNGSVINDANKNTYTSDYIDVVGGTKYTADVWATPTGNTNDTARGWVAVCFYDSNKTVVGSRTTNQGPWYVEHVSLTLEAPAGAAFARVASRLFKDGVMSLRASTVSLGFEASPTDAKAFDNLENVTTVSHNLVSMADLQYGYLYTDGQTGQSSYFTNDRTSGYIPVTEGATYTLSVSGTADSQGMWLAACFYDESEAFISPRAVKSTSAAGFQVLTMPVTAPAGAAFARVSARIFDDCVMVFQEGMAAKYSIAREDMRSLQRLTKRANTSPNVNSIEHRGSYRCPENTLPAVRDCMALGFSHVEVDVRFTSDGVPVILHDASINRTARNADGSAISSTVNIGSITYEQALTYDFGIAKNAAFAGTKIPTFEQVIKLCRSIGLGVYADLKSDGWTEGMITGLVQLARRCGMRGKVTWCDFNSSTLGVIRDFDERERLGFILESSPTDANVATVQSLMTGKNEVFIDSKVYDAATITRCSDAGIPLEAWVIDTVSVMESIDAYVTGITSNYTVYSQVIYKSGISKSLF